MKKIMVWVILTITIFSCTELLDEIDTSSIDEELGKDSIATVLGDEFSIPSESFLGLYFTSDNKNVPVSMRIEDGINHDFNSPVSDELKTQELSALWIGDFNFEAGKYLFDVLSDKGIKVIIDEEVVLDASKNSEKTTYEISRTLDGLHRLSVIYNRGENITLINDGSLETNNSSTTGESTGPVVEVNNGTPTIGVNWSVADPETIVDPTPSDKVGTFYTEEELKMWRERAQNGPFKMAGDAFPNSPGDWEYMLQDAERFGAEEYVLFQGPNLNANGQVSTDWHDWWEVDTWSNDKPTRLMIAAFVDRVRGTNEYTSKVKQILLAQAQVPNVDYADRYMYPNGSYADGIFGFSSWQLKLIRAYDYVGKDQFTPSEQKLLEDWFEAGALWHAREIDHGLSGIFLNERDGHVENYEIKPYYLEIRPEIHLYDGGPETSYGHSFYNNRRSGQARFVAFAGVLSDNQYLIDQAIIYFKEYLAFHWYPDGSFSEMERNGDYGGSATGLLYGAGTIAANAETAQVLYIGGYENLFEYTTQAGFTGTKSPGVNKSLEWTLTEYIKYLDGTYGDRTFGGNSINPYEENSIHWMPAGAVANSYYQNPAIRNAMKDFFPARPTSFGPYTNHYLTSGTGPAYMFMYAQ